MARIVDQIVVVKLSKLLKDSDADQSSLVNEEQLLAIETVVQELTGPQVIVELATD